MKLWGLILHRYKFRESRFKIKNSLSPASVIKPVVAKPEQPISAPPAQPIIDLDFDMDKY